VSVLCGGVCCCVKKGVSGHDELRKLRFKEKRKAATASTS
jgi:hypothetical protein